VVEGVVGSGGRIFVFDVEKVGVFSICFLWSGKKKEKRIKEREDCM